MIGPAGKDTGGRNNLHNGADRRGNDHHLQNVQRRIGGDGDRRTGNDTQPGARNDGPDSEAQNPGGRSNGQDNRQMGSDLLTSGIRSLPCNLVHAGHDRSPGHHLVGEIGENHEANSRSNNSDPDLALRSLPGNVQRTLVDDAGRSDLGSVPTIGGDHEKTGPDRRMGLPVIKTDSPSLVASEISDRKGLADRGSLLSGLADSRSGDRSQQQADQARLEWTNTGKLKSGGWSSRALRIRTGKGRARTCKTLKTLSMNRYQKGIAVYGKERFEQIIQDAKIQTQTG